MSISRIWAIVLRYLYLARHSLDRLSDMFFWPASDLVLWGLTSQYFVKAGGIFNNKLVLMILSGILLYILVWRAQYDITVSILEDIWNKNLGNIFVSPLKFSEWISALFAIGLIKGAISFSFAMILAFVLYKAKIFIYSFKFLVFIPLLLMTGWWVGLLIGGFILRFGTRIQTFAWTGVMLMVPFSAVYYPISTLPLWAQKVAKFVPLSYVFENMRSIILTGRFNPLDLVISFILTIFYFSLALYFFKKSFDRALERGLLSIY